MQNTGDKEIIIFSGFNQRAVIAFCRVAQRCQVPFKIIASSSKDTIFLSKYRQNVVFTRSDLSLKISDILAYLYQLKAMGENKHVQYVLLPSSEFLNRFFLDNRENLEASGCIIPLVSKELYQKISDKKSFGDLCNAYGIKTPKVIDSQKIIEYPVVAKPKRYFSARTNCILSPSIIESPFELECWIRENPVEDFYFQEFIGGSSFYLLYYFDRCGGYQVFSQRNLMQQPFGKSVVAAEPAFVHQEEIATQFAKLFTGEGFSGLVMVEIKYLNGEYYMIEANPRLWGPSQLFVDNGVDLFERFLMDCGFEIRTDGDCSHRGTNYFWLGGMCQTLKNHQNIVYHEYSAEQFIAKMDEFMKNEIYLRDDSIGIFQREIEGRV